jgi:predicted Fe-Mo cluster-binding NifX family protein
MKVAMPVFNGRVAPVFDWAGQIVLADTDTDGPAAPRREERGIADVAPARRGAFLKSAGVELLICGGISAALVALVEAEGIEVIPGIVGDTEKVLAAYRTGKLRGSRWAMPGWCGQAGGRRGRGRRGDGSCGPRSGRRRGRGWGPGPGGGVK